MTSGRVSIIVSYKCREQDMFSMDIPVNKANTRDGLLQYIFAKSPVKMNASRLDDMWKISVLGHDESIPLLAKKNATFLFGCDLNDYESDSIRLEFLDAGRSSSKK